MSAPTAAPPGTLPETQVRAMFDRIARVYDRMNSVMTAGMHHRWRESAGPPASITDASSAAPLMAAPAPSPSGWR